MKTYEELEEEIRELKEERDSLQRSLDYMRNEIEKVLKNRMKRKCAEINKYIKIVDNLIVKVASMQFPLPPKKE